ncbi:hypothetical protein [Acidianus sp. HS-5]|nr:hypothetical protein [Acidianus sp. HS-5]
MLQGIEVRSLENLEVFDLLLTESKILEIHALVLIIGYRRRESIKS